jgi:hypothetical protein
MGFSKPASPASGMAANRPNGLVSKILAGGPAGTLFLQQSLMLGSSTLVE